MKFFRNFSILHIEKDLSKKAKCEALKLNATKKQAFIKEKISESIGKPKELWESLKYLVMPNDTRSISTVFKNFFSNLAESLIELPNPPDKYNLESVINYYSSFTIAVDFCLNKTSEKTVLKIILKIEISKAVGIDKLSGRFLRDAVEFSLVLAKLQN